MGLPIQNSAYTVADYLRIERATEERHEYFDGVIYAMAVESNEHGDISLNLAGLIHRQLQGKPCRARTKDTKVCSGPTLIAGETRYAAFSYPDIVVICGELEFLDAKKDVILNPTTIIEAMSKSTESFDRGEKFTRYQTWNPSLKDYLLVSQDKPQIEHFIKQSDGGWSYYRSTGLEAAVTVSSIECTLKLAEVYERVEFAEP